jgi:hypothetical protein
VLFRTACIVLSLTAWASLSEADSLGDTFRVPDPEEIFEAYQEGFIDYDDYRQLLEIARAEFLTTADSLFLCQFPDLLAGFSSQPVIDGAEAEMSDADGGIASQPPHWRHAALFRQYHRLNDESDHRRIYRLQEEYGEAAFYGEFEEDYSHRRIWYRRSIEYRIQPDSSQNYSVILGNYQAQFALGLIYGYRGQLLAQADDPTRTESLLYPDYSGGNGIMAAADRSEGQYLLIYDVDRNSSFEKKYTGLSIPFRTGRFAARLSGGWGKITNVDEGSSLSVSLLSIAGEYVDDNVSIIGEAAADVNDRRRPAAAAGRVSCRQGRVYFRGEGWLYDDAFPTFFTGALSSRRSRTVYVEEIDFSYGDRYRGERGVALGSTVRMSTWTTVRTALLYAAREFDDDRIEARVGMKRRLNDHFRVGADFYWRDDHLYSGNKTQRRVQVEIVESGNRLRNRLVIGRRLYTYGEHNDYLVVFESGVRGSWGAASASCKFDRLRPESWANQYLYITAKYDVDIGGGIGSYVIYSYRYYRDNPGSSYGIIRWDVRWVIQ